MLQVVLNPDNFAVLVLGDFRVGRHGHQRLEVRSKRVRPLIHDSVCIDPAKLVIEQLLHGGCVALSVSGLQSAIGLQGRVVGGGPAGLRNQKSCGDGTQEGGSRQNVVRLQNE